MPVNCPGCGETYQRPKSHWNHNPSCKPSLDDEQRELLKGMLLGDGCASSDGRMVWYMTNLEFLNWLDARLGWASMGVLKDSGKRGEWTKSEVYVGKTPVHDEVESFRSWYDTGEKTYPDDLTLTPESVKMWYVGDGHLEQANTHRDRVEIRSTVPEEKKQPAVRAFNNEGLYPVVSDNCFRFNADETVDFFEYIGSPVPGFENKWP